MDQTINGKFYLIHRFNLSFINKVRLGENNLNWNNIMQITLGIKEFLIAVGFFLALFSGFSVLGRTVWFFELFTHFKIQYLIGLVLISFFFFLINHLYFSIIFFAFALLNIIQIGPLFSGKYYPELETNKTISYLQFNLNTENKQYEKVLNYLVAESPDIIFLQEFNSLWKDNLKDLKKIYPHSKNIVGDEDYSLAVYSKFPLSISKMGVRRNETLFLLATIKTSHGEFTFLGSHTMSPLSANRAKIRNSQLKEYAKVLNSISGPKILSGDLNISPWSPYFKDLLKRSKLENSSKGGKFHSSWPSFLIPMRISIDHFLHSPDIKIVKKEIGPDLGSDHYPVRISFVL